jgi:hypothetical protein
MPPVVALALRGEDFRAPFTPTAPTLASAPRQMARVTREAAASAATAERAAYGCRSPGPLLNDSSGVRAGELRRLEPLSALCMH